MGNTTSTTSRKHQKRTVAPRKMKQTKTPATGGAMRSLRARMSPATARSAPRTRTKKPVKIKTKRTKKPVKTNNASSMIRRFGPLAWTKAKTSGVGPMKTKRAPPPRKAGLLSRFGAKKHVY